MDGAPGGPLAGLSSSVGSILPAPKPKGGGGGGMNRNLSPMQFGKLGGGAGEAAAGGEAGGMAELAPLAVLA